MGEFRWGFSGSKPPIGVTTRTGYRAIIRAIKLRTGACGNAVEKFIYQLSKHAEG